MSPLPLAHAIAAAPTPKNAPRANGTSANTRLTATL